jgi:hypothetical protein
MKEGADKLDFIKIKIYLLLMTTKISKRQDTDYKKIFAKDIW